MGTAIGEILEKQEIGLAFLNGRMVGVDAFNTLYQFLSVIRGSDGTPLMDSKGRVTSHLTGLLYRTLNLLEAGAQPVFVFDGKPHELKGETIKERQRIRTDAKKKFEEAREKGEDEEARKYAQRAVQLSEEMIDGAKKLVELLGLPAIQAPSEGEAQVAAMVERGDLYGCVSQDYDALLFGTDRLLRNITISGKRKAPGRNFYYEIKPEMIELHANLKRLGIDRRKLIWIGILVGTDFNKKFPGVGPKTALQLVQKHSSFEEIIRKTKHQPLFDHEEIEELFMHPHFTEKYEIKFGLPDREKIKKFLCEEHDFSVERVESALNKISEKMGEKGAQSRLGQWG